MARHRQPYVLEVSAPGAFTYVERFASKSQAEQAWRDLQEDQRYGKVRPYDPELDGDR